MLPSYYDNVKEHENTLLTKFFGVYKIEWKAGRKVSCIGSFLLVLGLHRAEGAWTLKKNLCNYIWWWFIYSFFVQIRFVVMGNMSCTELRIHRRYDLKGSCQGRLTNKVDIRKKTTFKDLDLPSVFHMDKLLCESLPE